MALGRRTSGLLRHQVFSHVPLLDSISEIGGAASGGFYTLDRGESFDPPADRPFARTYGGGFRGLYDLADPAKSRFMIATGQSGHIFSRHYRDLYPLWNDVKSFPLTGTEEELKKAGAQELTLSPLNFPSPGGDSRGMTRELAAVSGCFRRHNLRCRH